MLSRLTERREYMEFWKIVSLIGECWQLRWTDEACYGAWYLVCVRFALDCKIRNLFKKRNIDTSQAMQEIPIRTGEKSGRDAEINTHFKSYLKHFCWHYGRKLVYSCLEQVYILKMLQRKQWCIPGNKFSFSFRTLWIICSLKTWRRVCETH